MRAWPRSNGDVRRPNGSATTYVENCTLSESRENRPRRSERSRRGQSPGPTPHALRGAYGGPSDVGCSEGRRKGRWLWIPETPSDGPEIRMSPEKRGDTWQETAWWKDWA
jgi:hypothetical protein